MGTRSTIKFYEDGVFLCCIYQQFNGYLEGGCNMSILQVGDRVKIVKRIDEWGEGTERDMWTKAMDSTIGKVGIITECIDSLSCEVIVDSVDYNFSNESLELMDHNDFIWHIKNKLIDIIADEDVLNSVANKLIATGIVF